MWKRKLTVFILRVLEVGVSTLLKPFSKARSLEIYSNRGYILFGIFLGLITWVFWTYLSQPLVSYPLFIRDLINLLFKPLGYNVPDTFPAVFVIIILYAIPALRTNWRLRIGEFFAEMFFRGISFAIGIGELCLEHRWVSLFIIFCLISLLTYGFIRESDRTSGDKILGNNFAHWLQEVDDFADKIIVTRFENKKYAPIRDHWDQDFNKLLKLPGNNMHPVNCLIKLLDALHLDNTDYAQSEDLRLKLHDLNKMIDECKRRPKDEMTYYELRGWAMIDMLMGRIYVRLSKGCQDCEELVKAKQCFDAIDVTRFNGDIEKTYKSSVNNGKGTVYANTTTAYLSRPAINLKSICDNANQCAKLALDAYEKAREAYEPCATYQGVRRFNNVVDLLEFHKIEALVRYLSEVNGPMPH
jgi:hypothetical protein